MNLKWERREGTKIMAPLIYSGDYVISCRPGEFNLSYRPTGEHHGLGHYHSEDEAIAAAEGHSDYRERDS